LFDAFIVTVYVPVDEMFWPGPSVIVFWHVDADAQVCIYPFTVMFILAWNRAKNICAPEISCDGRDEALVYVKDIIIGSAVDKCRRPYFNLRRVLTRNTICISHINFQRMRSDLLNRR